ncbi:unnamed protein product, partial [Ceratitis capitata]
TQSTTAAATAQRCQQFVPDRRHTLYILYILTAQYSLECDWLECCSAIEFVVFGLLWFELTSCVCRDCAHCRQVCSTDRRSVAGLTDMSVARRLTSRLTCILASVVVLPTRFTNFRKVLEQWKNWIFEKCMSRISAF